MDTPEFLAWSLEYCCPVRGLEDGSDPERVERHLRAARAFSDASREERIFENLAIDPPNGFKVSDALSIYGGAGELQAACRPCPANALGGLDRAALAGCVGLVPLPDRAQVHDAVEQATTDLRLLDEIAEHFPVTAPRWYGLWIDSPLAGQRLVLLQRLLEAASLAELAQACRTAIAAQVPLHVRLFPHGRIESGWWRLVPHCPRCQAAWPAGGAARCCICGYVGRPAPDKKRRARGSRPYRPLDRLLGQQQAAELLVRYEAFRARLELPDPGQNPPLPAPPDNPLAD